MVQSNKYHLFFVKKILDELNVSGTLLEPYSALQVVFHCHVNRLTFQTVKMLYG